MIKKRKIISEGDSAKRRKTTSPSISSPPGRWLDWPAPQAKIADARDFILECARERHETLLVPDKDADGLSSGKIMYNTLVSLGLPCEKIRVHMLGKCSSIFQNDEKATMEAYEATRIIVMDQGSRGGRPLVEPQGRVIRTLIIDHHESDDFPEGALVISACRNPPIATSSFLTYFICEPLHPSVRQKCALFALLGVFGDLGPNEVAWNDDPWPEYLGLIAKQFTKKALTAAVSMMNAPRRTKEYSVREAWEIIRRSETVEDISKSPVFNLARARVNEEVERCTHTAPKFSKDGRVALFRISSGYQVHPVIATRWAGHLKSRNLQVIMVANSGYHPSGQHTNFSCRIASFLRKLPDGQRPNIIEILKEYGRKTEDSEAFFKRVGGDFANGHKEASGGIILTTDFELLLNAMEIGVKPDRVSAPTKASKRVNNHDQTNKLTSYFSLVK